MDRKTFLQSLIGGAVVGAVVNKSSVAQPVACINADGLGGFGKPERMAIFKNTMPMGDSVVNENVRGFMLPELEPISRWTFGKIDSGLNRSDDGPDFVFHKGPQTT
jgi:hypothetical protein